jgi:hypothetical protein
MLCGGILGTAKALGGREMVITWGDLGMSLACVLRVELTRQDPMMNLWTSLAKGV